MPQELLALLVGVVIGVAATLTIFAARRAKARAIDEASPQLPDAVPAMLDVLDDAAVVTDASGNVVAASPTATWLGALPGERLEQDELRALMKVARQHGVSEAQTMRIRSGRLSREPRLVIARAAQIGRDYVLVSVRDISEQERLQQMRQDFIQNTSHELKTPVGAIALLAEALEVAADDPDQVRRFSERMSAEADRLGQLTGRIMNLSRLQAADELIDIGPVAVDEVVQGAIEANAVTAKAALVEVRSGGDKGLYVHGDSRVLVEAVSNLISNAVAYSPEGSHVGVGVRSAEGAVEIAVTDQGIGIADGDQRRVFERFFRADQARSRRTGGTGLGLSIVKHAIQRHGGEVRLWSREGQGSTFTIRLPQKNAPDGATFGGKRPKKGAIKKALRKETTA
ncbi:sensor histidine kinase [Microbacterium amylolyticum]|uniref:Sensor-like histidine kinase SenX3 n=1 Tax=Microbacterium amylolyticum TaxID=936337 RepID=A0ABS4ZIU8_9MICO|nr:ATP-binding protein [Microbacterium amylolyticum]MBP2437202.1 two-component system sensor histidine kinase SenX3 [Microbacterium amylolyticum]